MKIFLVGLPGSGKSTLGKALAEKLSLHFVDLDKEVERKAGKEIKEIFRADGEDHFRKIESQILAQWANSDKDFVMATGGGAPCFFDGIKIINYSGTSIFLDVPPQEIVARVDTAERAVRPLLGKIQEENLLEEISRMRTKRLAVYTQAKITLSGEKISPDELLGKLNA